MFKRTILGATLALMLAGCGQVSYVQRETPNKEFQDYKEQTAAVLGVGEPISKRQMRANATLSAKGLLSLEDAMRRLASTYNVAVRWGAGVRRDDSRDLLLSELNFDEARAYLEDVYKVQIIREGERRLLVLPAVDAQRIEEFSPGQNLPLAEVVKGLAEQCGKNLVITENKDVLANTYITTSLKNVTCSDAFDAILGPHGLSIEDQGDYAVIAGLPSRQWALNLYEPIRNEEQRVSYTSSLQTNSEGDSGSDEGTGGNASGGSTLAISREERNLWAEVEQDLNTLIQRSCTELRAARSEGRAAVPAAMTGAIAGLPTPTPAAPAASRAQSAEVDCGYVRINRAVGMIQMRAPRTVLAEADRIVKNTEEIASRRLLVEARVVAVSRNRGFNQGADWGGQILNNPDVSIGFTPAEALLRGADNRSIASGVANILEANGGAFLSASGGNIDAVVRLIEQFGTTYQLLQPTLEVMDRQRATIIDGRNERYFIRETETVSGTGGSAPIVNVTANERNQFVGLQFSVTAQIADQLDGLHTIQMQLPITEISRFIKLQQGTGNDKTNDDIPIATTRVLDQKVRIRDGEIKVIGGLTRTMAVDKESGIPLIRGVPVAGKLFNEENITFEDVEFIVLLQVRRLD